MKVSEMRGLNVPNTQKNMENVKRRRSQFDINEVELEKDALPAVTLV